MIPYGRQHISEEDIAAVVDVLRSDWLTQGPMVGRFEAAVASYCGVGHGVAANSATSSLHLAYLALGLGPGRRLWTTPLTFVATANAARHCGAEVDFVDIDPDNLNLSIPHLADKLAEAEKAGSLPHIVAPVHFAGRSCDMAQLGKLAQRYSFRLVEDASHALGASYRNKPVGNCSHSDITVFSFHPVKPITTGEGGMAMTGNAELAQSMALLRSHGITRNPAELAHPDEGAWYYEQHEAGFNYRLTDMQAALGLSQLARLDAFTQRRRQIVRRYHEALADTGLSLPLPDETASWHIYPVQLPLASQRRYAFDALRAAGIFVQVHYLPVSLQPDYRRQGFLPGQFPAAEDYYSRAISLPVYPSLSDDEQTFVIEQVRKVLA